VDPLFLRRAKRLPLAGKTLRDAYQRAAGCSQGDGEGEAEQEEEEAKEKKRARHAFDGEECPVCFEDMKASEEAKGKLVFCCACGNNFHGDCIRRWQTASSGDCPLCREPWQTASQRVKPGEPLPCAAVSRTAPSREGSFNGQAYLNLSSVASEGD
ncbi:unnamed protein product, partial [Polarella glacialis]